jgi:hypothetical protein
MLFINQQLEIGPIAASTTNALSMWKLYLKIVIIITLYIEDFETARR